MKFDPPLQQATLIKRYKRFLADVELPDGSQQTLHCPNTGSMKNCGAPGDPIWFSLSDNPKRKYPGTWELVQDAQGHLICINTGRANALVAAAITAHQVEALDGYGKLSREVRYGAENSRADLMLSEGSQPDAFIEVKSVTLLENGQGYFPDAVTTRGQKHLRELMAMRLQGYRAVLVFAVLHTGITSVRAAAHIDPIYSELLAKAKQTGVEVLQMIFNITPSGVHFSTVKV